MTLSEVSSWLREHDDYLIITHRRPDGDTLGSAAALVRGLRAYGKNAYIFKNEETTSKYLGFVSPFWAPDSFDFSHIVSVDVASEGLFPRGSDHLLGRTDLSIDHHPSNTGYARLTYADGSKAACGEIIYDLLIDLNGDIDDDTAAALYTAISTDTGCFAFGNTTQNTFRCAALVAEKNGAKEAVVYVSSATPEMIVCVKGANNDSASGIIAAVKKIISNYIENYTEYGPEQVAKLQSAVIKQDGAYVFIAVTNDNAAADSYISGLLKK